MSDDRPTDPSVCAWQRDEDGNDATECGGIWCLNDGTPPENGMKFCPYCGKSIAWLDYAEPEDEEDGDYDPYEAAGESPFSLPGGGKSL